jgi:urate oxidase/2-oxo-4-hydroxy-4-carboxy-5-ureidoimidazoline decarboxylase
LERFASGWKRSYYGKGDVIVYRLNRDGSAAKDASPVFGASVKILIYGDAFWRTYSEGDNTGLIATDSMKNFIQRETLQWAGCDLEDLCSFLGVKFLEKYPQTDGVQISAEEIPYARWSGAGAAFSPGGPEFFFARTEIARGGKIEMVSGVHGFRMLRLGGSAFCGFVRDEYTTLPEIRNRPLNMWLDVEWSYELPSLALSAGAIPRCVQRILREVFAGFESGSIQQIIYQMGTRALDEVPEISEIHLEANNRTWDTVVEMGDELGTYTDARPPYGCLGLCLRRS